MAQDVLEIVVDAYRRNSPPNHRVQARILLDSLPRWAVEQELAELFDCGVAVPGPGGTVNLSPRVRGSVLSRSVLAGWVAQALASDQLVREVLLTAIRVEVREISGVCLDAPESRALRRRGAQLLGVLRMVDLDPQAFEVVDEMPGSLSQRIKAISELPERSCLSPRDLRTACYASVRG